ncbi:hypothetical protein F6X67_33245, partial [Pseudomonas aeruginosa]
MGRRWPGGVAAAGRLAAGARVARRRRAGLPGGRRRAPGALAHARPALGPDLTLILCGALLIRHAWMQARAAAPPAHPRVTGDHHA